jgi:hypothetical protein
MGAFPESRVHQESFPEFSSMSHSTIKTRQEPFTLHRDVEEIVRQRLTQNCPYRSYFQMISFEYADETLKLHGKLPTFYLKQILQTMLFDIDGVSQIDNRVDVVSSSGLSSVPKNEAVSRKRLRPTVRSRTNGRFRPIFPNPPNRNNPYNCETTASETALNMTAVVVLWSRPVTADVFG